MAFALSMVLLFKTSFAAAMARTGQLASTVPLSIEACAAKHGVLRTSSCTNQRAVSSVLHDASPMIGKRSDCSGEFIDCKRKRSRQVARTAPSSSSQRLATASLACSKAKLVSSCTQRDAGICPAPINATAQNSHSHAPETSERSMHDLSPRQGRGL